MSTELQDIAGSGSGGTQKILKIIDAHKDEMSSRIAKLMIINLFDVNDPDYAPGQVLANDTLSPDANYNTTGFIKVAASDYISVSPAGTGVIRYITYYNINKERVGSSISQPDNSTYLLVPDGISYCRISFYNTKLSTFMVELGQTRHDYIKGYTCIDETGVSLNSKYATYDYVAFKNLIFVENLFKINDPDYQPGKVLYNDNFTTDANYNTTGFIKLTPAGYIFLALNAGLIRWGSYYDINKNRIGNSIAFPSPGAYLVPSNYYYVRYTVSAVATKFMINEGQTGLPFTATNYIKPDSYLFNKSVGFEGDSVTYQSLFINYADSIMRFGSISNYGVGGTRISGVDTTAMNNDARVNAISTDNKLLHVMGGINDWANDVPLGTIDSVDVTTFYGALNVWITKLINRVGGSNKVVTMTISGTTGTADVTMGAGTLLIDKTLTFNTDIPTTLSDFVTANAAYYAGINVDLTSSGNDLIFTATNKTFTTPQLANVSNDLSYSNVITDVDNICKIVIGIPHYCEIYDYAVRGWSNSYENNLGLTIDDYAEAKRNIASKYKLKMIDYNSELWSKENFEIYIKNDITEAGARVHPNQIGGEEMGKVFVQKLYNI